MKRWAILCGAVIVLIVILADTGRLGFLHAAYDFPDGDKAGHFLLFGLLSLAVNLAVLEARPTEKSSSLSLKTSLLLALLIALEELSQRWVPGRTSSWLDLAASYLGVMVFAWLAVQINRRRKDPLKPQE